MPIASERRRGEDAVSTVVSAVLVFSLITVVLGVYLSTIVPDQIADAEAVHMRRISSSLADMAAQVEGTITLGREGEFTTQVDLGATNIAGGLLKQSSGSLRLIENAFFANFHCPIPKLLARNGNAAPGGTSVALGGPGTTLDSLVALELRLTAYTFVVDPVPTNEVARIEVNSGTNLVARFEMVLVAEENPHRVHVTVIDSTGFNKVYDQPFLIDPPTLVSLQINVLDPTYGFSSLIADAASPLTLSSVGPGAASLYAVYWKTDGTLRTLGTGRDVPGGFQRTLLPSTLIYRSSNSEFMDQTYSLEGGGIVLSQANGEYLNLAPFSITKNGGNPILRLSLVNFTGTGQVSGSHRATVSLSVRAPTTSIVQCTAPLVPPPPADPPPPQLIFKSEYPVAWHATWTDALSGAGLDPARASLSDGVVRVNLEGTWTVLLSEARVTVRVG